MLLLGALALLLGTLMLLLGALALLLGALALLLTLLHEFDIGRKAFTVRLLHLQRTAFEFEAHPESWTDPTLHRRNLFQGLALTLPAAEFPTVRIV